MSPEIPNGNVNDGGHDIFISYSTRNSEEANKICYVLEQNNLKCWIAPRNIASGKNYITMIGEAIRSAKIVVLVFSKYSQESKYVNNEINMAYSHNKRILSVNIDDTMPKEEMEYYLKVTQWLTAYPVLEDSFEKLVADAYELCSIKTDVPIIVDFSNYKQEDLSRHKKDYASLILLFTPLYWASFIYMGIASSKRIWLLMGIVYLIPTLVCLMIYFQIIAKLFMMYPVLVLFSLIFLMFWALAIIHGLVIRNEFLTRRSVLRFTSSDDELFKYLYDEYLQV